MKLVIAITLALCLLLVILTGCWLALHGIQEGFIILSICAVAVIIVGGFCFVVFDEIF